ncbi:MAG: PQQ-binding-like beta-propeller repeat protein, partial [Pseudomonadota bacterium]
DIPSPAQLTTLAIGERQIDVVIAVTKIGNTLILDRDTGRPVFDFDYVRAPTSTVPGERTAPYQPDLVLPEPLIETAFGPEQITDLSPEKEADILFQLENAVYGKYAPPALNKILIVNGLHGGAEWPGGAIDPYRGRMYTTVNLVPWQLRIFLMTAEPGLKPANASIKIYKRMCASCHGGDRNGRYHTIREIDEGVVPTLNGISFDPRNRNFFETDYFTHRHQFTIGAPKPSQPELDELWDLMVEWDDKQVAENNFGVNYQWSQLVDKDGLPGSKPPWGLIVAMDLTTGRQLWARPYGEHMIDGEMRNVGKPSFGGATVTAGGVLFATGTSDRKFRAFDPDTGAELWSFELEAAGTTPPITFSWKGVQYVSLMATGGKFHDFERPASKLYTFRLSDDAIGG